MNFESVLFAGTEHEKCAAGQPACFFDLNLDQVVETITTGREEYELKPFFWTPLRSVDAIYYRHEIFRDLENKMLLDCVNAFAERMRSVRQHVGVAQRLYYKEHKQGWFLDAVEIYCQAIRKLADDLVRTNLRSRGLLGFRHYLTSYVNSPQFTSLLSDTEKLKNDLATVRYCVLIKGASVTVRKYRAELDYSAEVERTFEKFKQGAAKDYLVRYPEHDDMNHVEAKILEFVAKLYPEIFAALDEYYVRNADFIDRTVLNFDREIQFFLSYLEYIAILKQAGLQFCYPRVSDTNKNILNRHGFDVALAHKLSKDNKPVVCNDFFLRGRERIFVVSGPNQGGKTTFARAFGQLHYLASIGCPVPGRAARLFLFDKLLTHFERAEKVENLRGKLEDDLVRIRDILSEATSRSIVVLNEIFTSTTLQDEIFLSTKLLKKIIDRDLLCVWVTFVDELASFGPQTVSMVSTVVPDNPALRTFKIVRRPADGLAYAMAIARKYRLTYESIKERMRA